MPRVASDHVDCCSTGMVGKEQHSIRSTYRRNDLAVISKYASDKRTQDLNDFCAGVNMSASRKDLMGEHTHYWVQASTKGTRGAAL
jgi:hypothetical protein